MFSTKIPPLCGFKKGAAHQYLCRLNVEINRKGASHRNINAGTLLVICN